MKRRSSIRLGIAGAVALGLVPAATCGAPITAAVAAPPRAGIVAEPFAARTGEHGPTLFHTLDSAATGIVTENRYDDPTMWTTRYAEFKVGSLGTGVAIGDYDNDGRPDIFVVSKTESCRLFRNLGGWKFEDVTEKAGVGDKGEAARIWKEGATFVDINNDGMLDIYVCRLGAPNLLYVNQGDGTFKEQAAQRGLAIDDGCVMAAFCDYDRDGFLDVLIQTNSPEWMGHPRPQRNYLLHNNGDGIFKDVTPQSGITGRGQGHAAIWWDYDGDGWPDLYVGYDFTPTDRLFHNNRDGTFTEVIDQVVPHMPFSTMGIDLGDVNNDGLIDLFASDMAATSRASDQRTIANTRALLTDPPVGSFAAPQVMRNTLYLNTGTGRCLEAAFLAGLAATDWTWSVRLEDFDNDGRLDLFVTNGMYRDLDDFDLMDRIAKVESLQGKVAIERASPELPQRNLAFRNLGDLRFMEVGREWGLDQLGISFGAAIGDLDGDGNLDIVYSNYHSGVTVLRNECDTGHRVIVRLRGTRSNRFGLGAIVRIETAAGIQVRPLVLARGLLSSSDPSLHFGLGTDAVIRRLTVSWPSGCVQNLDNLPADFLYTITEPAAEGAAAPAPPPPRATQFVEVGNAEQFSVVTRELPVDETAVQRLLPARQSRRGPALAVGDIDGDGIDDVVVGGTLPDPIRLLRNAGAAGLALLDAAVMDSDNPVDDGPVLLFDAGGSGHNDLLITKGGAALPGGVREYQPKLYLNDGKGGFRAAAEGWLPALSISAGAAVAGDFDRDGKLDVFIGGRLMPGQYPVAPQSALLANRGGRFEDVTDAMAPGLKHVGMVTSALWSDVDGDGWLDLLVTLEWGHVKYFHNNQGHGFEDWTERAGFAAAGTGWWTSIAAADFNGDGRMDYVVGNVGLNTPYAASPEHPALLYYDDFAGDGTVQLIEAEYEGDKLYPRRTRRELGAVIPSILRRYRTNDAYAKATLGEILGEAKLEAAPRLAATELRSGVFLSQADGTFRFEPLPTLAQISPLQGLVAGDFDGDGKADIIAVQNSYAPIPSVGRFDGGLGVVLRGDGRGAFTVVPPAQSGFVVPGDAKALAVVDFDQDGRPDLLVTRNNSAGLAFRNAKAPGKFLRVTLRGPRGNPTGIGARLELKLAEGATQKTEIHAGAGMYAQSTADCFFGYADADLPREIGVRWPDGKETSHRVAPNATTLTLSRPAP